MNGYRGRRFGAKPRCSAPNRHDQAPDNNAATTFDRPVNSALRTPSSMNSPLDSNDSISNSRSARHRTGIDAPARPSITNRTEHVVSQQMRTPPSRSTARRHKGGTPAAVFVTHPPMDWPRPEGFYFWPEPIRRHAWQRNTFRRGTLVVTPPTTPGRAGTRDQNPARRYRSQDTAAASADQTLRPARPSRSSLPRRGARTGQTTKARPLAGNDPERIAPQIPRAHPRPVPPRTQTRRVRSIPPQGRPAPRETARPNTNQKATLCVFVSHCSPC